MSESIERTFHLKHVPAHLDQPYYILDLETDLAREYGPPADGKIFGIDDIDMPFAAMHMEWSESYMFVWSSKRD